jgi:hypothetical protein
VTHVFSVGDMADADDRIAWSSFRLVFAPALTLHIHRHVAQVVHRARRCPEARESGDLGLTLCDRCADHVDAEHDVRFRKLRDVLGSESSSPGQELKKLARFLRSPDARKIDATEGSKALLRFKSPEPAEAPQWVRWAFFQLIHRTSVQVVIDAQRRERGRLGAAQRLERDLLTAKWAVKLWPDEASRRLLVDHVNALHSGHTTPDYPYDVRVTIARELNRLRRERPEFYNSNIEGFLLRGRMAQDTDERWDQARLLWTTSPEETPRQSDAAEQERSRQRILDLLDAPPATARRVSRFLGSLCDIAFGRGARRSVSDIAVVPVDELARAVLHAGLEWVDALVARTGE